MAPLPALALRQGSLTEGQESVLVNASNTNGLLGSGVSAAIRKACGPKFQDTITQALTAKFGGPMEPGQVLVTDAGADAHASWVVHVAVMDYRQGFTGGSYPTVALIEEACARLWDAVESLPDAKQHSVAMVALGAGTGNLGVAEPTRVALSTLRTHVQRRPSTRIERVVFCGYLVHEYLAMGHELAEFEPSLLDSLPADVRSAIAHRRAH